ncbi:intein C-terminal splicing region/RHS repeat-associated core domain-containing protein [Clostridium collagenovorans DSM 3089]|uniref:Intein C-terminal splicing region/RHS repeat-associated core domain-containing protein n=1 Tax=Clostridium collagenovorans DSM 3089 TaxID=1121306 RepID=A0A1M5TE41_9CLOT|nr:polymorphic toxin-type HINT domain-containing protein [Clostridium collagenovorans]SHH48966.1 intein C-terminal splicing region/RHS repeat-associated core domain-containing protein [Clostridium collagenovorans DSM 3089]
MISKYLKISHFKRNIVLLLCSIMIINIITPGLKVFASEENSNKDNLDYVLFSNSNKNNLKFNVNSTFIEGNIYCGNDVEYTGEENLYINGDANILGEYEINKFNITKEKKNEKEKMASILEETVKNNNYGAVYKEDVEFKEDILDISKSLKVDGSLWINRTVLSGEGCILSKNDIKYDAINDKKNQYNVFLGSEEGNITISGSDIVINGIIYAPKGKVKINAKKLTVSGAIYADNIEFNGTQLTVNKNEKLVSGQLFKPDIVIEETGELKENRKITLDISKNKDCDILTEKNTVWSITPINHSNKDTSKEESVFIDEENSNAFTKNLIIKHSGEYLVKIKTKTNKRSYEYEKKLIIGEDKAPIADFTVKPVNLRGEDKKAKVEIKDISYSKDGDTIVNRIWSIQYDSNNNGDFSDEESKVISDRNETSVTFETSNVGKYKIELYVEETFDNTIEKFISKEDYKTANTENKIVQQKIFMVDNVKPEASIELETVPKTDLVFTVSNADTDKINKYGSKIEELKGSLEDQGIKTNISTVTTSSLTAQDKFAWKEYDHYNYSDWYLPTLEKHIIYEKNNIKMLGYSRTPLKDFLFVDDKNSSQKIFNFDIQRDTTDWHSIEGGGFLFNTTIENNKINGYCILLTQQGLKLVQINNANLDSFQNGGYEYVQNAGRLLQSFPISNLYAKHHIKIVVDSRSISVWDNDKIIIDNYKLPEENIGFGYGPITSHASHGCSQQSYFTFENIKMETVTGKSLAKVLEGYDWTEGASKYVINLSDEEVPDFKGDKQVGIVSKSLIENNIKFAGIGNEKNKAQYEKILKNTDGIYLDGEDILKSMDTLSNYVMSNEISKDYSVDRYITLEDEISYRNHYKDYENDEIEEELWEYEHDPKIFDNELKEIELISQNEPITKFIKTGAYSIRVKVRDNPVGNQEGLDEYKKWSDESIFQKVLIANTRPIADMDVNVYKDSKSKESCIINVVNKSFDNDHKSFENKGIEETNYKWKNIKEDKWNEGTIPNRAKVGETYLLALTVKDKEGILSNPCVKIIETDSLKEPEIVEDKEAPKIYIDLSKIKANVGEAVEIKAYAIDNMGVDNFELYINDEKVISNPGRIFYTGNKEEIVSIEAKARDIYGNESTEKRELQIIDDRDKIPPTIEVDNILQESLNTSPIKVIGTIKDNIALKYYKLEYKLKGTENFETLKEEAKEVSNGIIGEINPNILENGTYELRISAEDVAGNRVYVTYEYTINIEEGSRPTEKDTEPPKITIELSTTKAKLNEKINAIIKVEDNKAVEKVEVFKDEKLVMNSPGEIEFSEATAGIRKIKVIALDKEGNKSIKEAEVMIIDDRDKNSPIVNITSPLNGEVVKDKVSIKGTVKDDISLEKYKLQYKATASNQFITFAESTQCKENEEIGILDTNNLQDGNYKVRLIAEDKGGNTSIIEHEYIVDNKKKVDPDEPGQSNPDIESPKIKIALSNYTPEIGEEIKGYISVWDNVKVAEVKAFIDGKETQIVNNQISLTINELKTVFIEVTASDESGNKSRLETQCTAYNKEDKIPPKAEIKEIEEIITKPTTIIGTAKDETELSKYVLEYREKGDIKFNQFHESEVEKDNEVLGKFDPTTLGNGIYEIRLKAIDKGGNEATSIATVIVEGKMKIGHLSLGFQDITANLSGLNLSLNRNYDNRNKKNGDFGIGWTLGLDNIKFYERTKLGEGYEQIKQGSLLTTTYVVKETEPHDVMINYGDGTSDRFKVVLSPKQQLYVPLYSTNIEFECITNPNIKLEINGNKEKFIGGKVGYVENIDDFDPQEFILTTKDQSKIYFNKYTGIKSIESINGDKIKVTENGYEHSSGRGITFKRDSKGRIVEAKDPVSNVTSYNYDNNGDLVSVTNPLGNKVQFKYDDNHNIIEMLDPTGTPIVRNEYDEAGKIIRSIDAEGNVIEYTHDIDGRQEVVKDKLGNNTIYTYDDEGNVLSVIDALGNKTLNKYDDNNNLISSTDPLGNVTNFEYDSKNNLISSIDSLGNKINNTFNDRGQLTKIQGMGVTSLLVNYDENGNVSDASDAEGNKTSYSYDKNGKLSGVTDKLGSLLNVVYDSKGNVTSTIDANGNATEYNYDDLGRCISKKINKKIVNQDSKKKSNDTEVLTEVYVYDKLNNIIQVIDAEGNISIIEYNVSNKVEYVLDAKNRKTSYHYDKLGNLTEINYYDNTKETFKYDEKGNMIEAIDRNGQKLTYTYDKLDRLLSITLINGSKKEYSYDEKGRLKTESSLSGEVTSYEYDTLDRNTSITDAYGNKIKFTYNNASKLETMTDALGNVYKYEYDKNGNRTKLTLPDLTTMTLEYDERGRVVKEINQNNEETNYKYDKVDNLVEVKDALGGRWKYQYNEVGELASVEDANNNITKYQYDKLGRPIKVISPLGYEATTTYDEIGNVKSFTNYSGIKTTYEYDEGYRLVKETIKDDTIEYFYNKFGLLESVIDKHGETKYKYNELNLLEEKTLPNNVKLTYNYDKSGRISKFITPYGNTSYEYDKLDRIQRVVGRNGEATVYEYDALGNRTKVKYANGVTMKYSYDKCSRLVKEETLDKNGQVISKYLYTLGKCGERLKVEELDQSIEYKYDEINRLIEEKIIGSKKEKNYKYKYDAVGNRLSKEEDGIETTYKYNKLNQLLKENKENSETSYSYDKNGSLINQYSGEQNVAYSYNNKSQLINTTIQKGSEVSIESYEYDFEGNRIEKTVNEETINYIVNTNDYLAQVVAEVDERGNLLTYYNRGEELINLEREGNREKSKEIKYYLYDGHGSVRALVDKNGTVTDIYKYDAFGNILESEGSTENSYLYAGEQYDANTGFYYLRARYMNPKTGTFVSMDEYPGSVYDPVSLHKYLYANANPVMYKDPTGYFSLAELQVSTAISTILDSVQVMQIKKFFNIVNALTTIVDTGSTVLSLINGTASLSDVCAALAKGMLTGTLLNKICAISAVSVILKPILVVMDLVPILDGIQQALKDKNYPLAGLRILQGLAAIFGGTQSCFVGETLVSTENGEKRIDEIKEGEYVWAENIETGEKELKKVLRVYENETDKIVHIKVNGEEIESTENHPFYVEERGWVSASELKVGDKLRSKEDKIVVVEEVEIEQLKEKIKVYNLEVEDNHNYYVSGNKVLVHNTCKEGGDKAKTGPKPFGTGPHNKKIAEVADSVTDGTVIAGGQRLPERGFKTPNGKKSSRRPDILVEKPDGSIYGINLGKTTKSGVPIKREVEALYDLEDIGIDMHFVPYFK